MVAHEGPNVIGSSKAQGMTNILHKIQHHHQCERRDDANKQESM